MKSKDKRGKTPDLRRITVKRKPAEEAVISVVKLNAQVRATTRVRQVVKLVNIAVTSGPGVLGLVPPEQSGLLADPPVGWPNNLLWKPRRYYGPFWEGSSLSHIEISVQGPSTATWYYNDYFSGNPDAAQYQAFFGGQNLPAQKTPGMPRVPGYMPPSDGAGQFVCFLDRIEYSSRYGGTIALTFRQQSDTGLEVRQGNYVWDLKHLELRIYVTPTAQGLQNPAIAYSQGSVACEISSQGQVCYSVPTPGSFTSPGTPFQALDDAHLAELTQALALLSQEVAKDIAPEARRFVGGFLWAQFPDLLGVGRIVESIILSDNLIQLFTRQGIPVVHVCFRLSHVFSIGGDSLSEDELRVTLDSLCVYNGGIVKGPVNKFDVECFDDTPWVTAGQWNLDEIPNIQSIILRVSGVEMDWPDADDEFNTYEAALIPDYAELLAAHNAHQYGLIEEVKWGSEDLGPGSEWLLWLDVQARVYLGVR